MDKILNFVLTTAAVGLGTFFALKAGNLTKEKQKSENEGSGN